MDTNLFQSPARVLYLRLTNINVLVVLIALVIALYSEFRYNATEVILGNYLVLHNADREKIGRIWEQAKKSEEAKASLEQLALDKNIVSSDKLTFQNFKEVAAILGQTDSLFLAKDRFIDLYLKVPETAKEKILSPAELLRLEYLSNWYRVFITRSEKSAQLFFVDTDNMILRERELSLDAFANLNSHFDTILEGKLVDYSHFRSQIYSRSYYFESLYRLTTESRDIFLHNASAFLKFGQKLQNVGISDTSKDGYIEIGYEVLDKGKRKIYVDKVEDYYILDLIVAFES